MVATKRLLTEIVRVRIPKGYYLECRWEAIGAQKYLFQFQIFASVLLLIPKKNEVKVSKGSGA